MFAAVFGGVTNSNVVSDTADIVEIDRLDSIACWTIGCIAFTAVFFILSRHPTGPWAEWGRECPFHMLVSMELVNYSMDYTAILICAKNT